MLHGIDMRYRKTKDSFINYSVFIFIFRLLSHYFLYNSRRTGIVFQ